jgi:hypothetical protein
MVVPWLEVTSFALATVQWLTATTVLALDSIVACLWAIPVVTILTASRCLRARSSAASESVYSSGRTTKKRRHKSSWVFNPNPACRKASRVLTHLSFTKIVNGRLPWIS